MPLSMSIKKKQKTCHRQNMTKNKSNYKNSRQKLEVI